MPSASSPDNAAPAAASISRGFLTAKCDYFVDVHLWPIKTRLNPERWLSNFTEDELDHAVHLLNGFMYFCNALTEQLFVSAFQRLSMVGTFGGSIRRARTSWASFVDSVLVTRVTGEDPRDTDSGYIFERMARQKLRIDESRILPPSEALERLLIKRTGRIVFVDDFVGSGNQFKDTWKREYDLDGRSISYKRAAASLPGIEFTYCPLVATEYGLRQIREICPEVLVAPAHVLPERYSTLVADSIIWPPHLADSGPDFVRDVSARAGIPGNSWKGFHGLGLALAFEHCVPDATLPIFYWTKNDWRPLLERS